MKNAFIILIILLQVTTLMATILVVDNNQYSPAPFTNLQTAINSATSGDTLLVKASSTSYGSIVIDNKTLHIVGEGYKPHYQYPYTTKLDQVLFTNFGTVWNSSNSTIEGCRALNIKSLSTEPTNPILNIIIRRCSSTVEIGNYSSALVYNNILPGGGLMRKATLSSSFHNNIIQGGITLDLAPPFNGNHLIKNNVFISTPGGYAHYSSSSWRLGNSVVSDNIYHGISPNQDVTGWIINCNFSHNISYASINDTFLTTGTNTGGNNQAGVNPMFVSETNFVFGYTDDFHLLNTSPGKNAGSDGTDIGIYGGLYPWPDGNEASGSSYMYSQEPQYPQVNMMNIQNGTVPSNGTIQIQVKGISNQ